MFKPMISRNFLKGDDIYHFHPEKSLVFTPYNIFYNWKQPSILINNGKVKITEIYPKPKSDYNEVLEFEDGHLLKTITSTSDFKTCKIFDKKQNLIDDEGRNQYQYKYNENSDIVSISGCDEEKLYYKYVEFNNNKYVFKFNPDSYYSCDLDVDLFEKHDSSLNQFSKFRNFKFRKLLDMNKKERINFIEDIIVNPNTIYKLGVKLSLDNYKEYNYDKLGNLVEIKNSRYIIPYPYETQHKTTSTKFEYNNKFQKISKIIKNGKIIFDYDYDNFGNIKLYRYIDEINRTEGNILFKYKYDDNLVVEQKQISKNKIRHLNFEYLDIIKKEEH